MLFQIYFVDHNNRTTQFTDPRLNSHVLNNLLRRISTVPVSSSSTTTTTASPLTVNTTTATTVAIQHQPPPSINQNPQLPPSQPPIPLQSQQQPQQPPSLQSQQGAVPFCPRPRPVEDLPQSLLNENEHLPKYRRDLVAKLKVLRAELQALQPQSGHCRLEVSRNEVFEESYRWDITL